MNVVWIVRLINLTHSVKVRLKQVMERKWLGYDIDIIKFVTYLRFSETETKCHGIIIAKNSRG